MKSLLLVLGVVVFGLGCSLTLEAQTYDKIQPCNILICDTLHYTNYNEQYQYNHFDKIGMAFWVTGYVGLKKHNTGEGVIDPYACFGCTYTDYYVVVSYLDSDKKPLAKSILIWMYK